MEKTFPWKLNFLCLTQIESENTPFNWFPQKLSEKDQDFFLKSGIILPLLVWEVLGSRYLLVDGFKRLNFHKSCDEFSSQEKLDIRLPCLVIPESLPLIEVLRVRLQTLPSSGINLFGFRVSSLLNILYKNGFSKEEISDELILRLGIKLPHRLVNQMIKLNEIITKLKQEEQFSFSDYIKKLGCEDFVALHRFSKKDMVSISSFAEIMQISGNKWRHMLQLLDEVCRMLEISVNDLLDMYEFREILTKKNLQPPVRTRLIKQELFFLRYPELNNLKNKFVQRLDRLELPKRISLHYDPFFEDEDLSLIFKMNSFKELKNHFKYLEDIFSNKNKGNKKKFWEDLFALMDEE